MLLWVEPKSSMRHPVCATFSRAKTPRTTVQAKAFGLTPSDSAGLGSEAACILKCNLRTWDARPRALLPRASRSRVTAILNRDTGKNFCSCVVRDYLMASNTTRKRHDVKRKTTGSRRNRQFLCLKSVYGPKRNPAWTRFPWTELRHHWYGNETIMSRLR
jgi:hypothetical protein